MSLSLIFAIDNDIRVISVKVWFRELWDLGWRRRWLVMVISQVVGIVSILWISMLMMMLLLFMMLVVLVVVMTMVLVVVLVLMMPIQAVSQAWWNRRSPLLRRLVMLFAVVFMAWHNNRVLTVLMLLLVSMVLVLVLVSLEMMLMASLSSRNMGVDERGWLLLILVIVCLEPSFIVRLSLDLWFFWLAIQSNVVPLTNGWQIVSMRHLVDIGGLNI